MRHAPLTVGGTFAAACVGVGALVGGWPWGVLVIVWFLTSQALTRRGAALKAARTAAILAPERARNARQVFANGGVFAACVVIGTLTQDARWSLAAVGALAAAAADTWATEIGLVGGGTPRSLLRGVPVPPGTSGGVTWRGTLGGAAGALVVALLAAWLVPATLGVDARNHTAVVTRLAAAGLLGALADSILGATLQSQRRCSACGALTERRVHSCGGQTAHARGLPWLDNDAVNFLATVTGAILALWLL